MGAITAGWGRNAAGVVPVVPPPADEASADQLTGLKVSTGAVPPTFDFTAWGPFHSRFERKQMFAGYVVWEVGNLQKKAEINGGADWRIPVHNRWSDSEASCRRSSPSQE